MEDDYEGELKKKEDLHIAGGYTALDISRFAEFLHCILKFLLGSRGIAQDGEKFSWRGKGMIHNFPIP